ncbi:AMMECR1 domain protein [Halorhabdus tiamatea SARL4B]|uniref:Protein HLRTI_002811 n=1 Tax=Halorhabdus tiamatea SARL4B TaxID=1033806 RepID=F7PL94_9EURY|nr:AmmeMemoRadiSam system protein A [Halorhabdus tiamatea]ERJ05183.1 AMMECR1 domain protein [Halorhabdus tiamatea SARL4B]CCQ34746.1 AMMECR1 domain protein [Halorhabdus tiamatea SARL4B]
MTTGENYPGLDSETGKRLLAYARAVVEAIVTDESPPETPELSVLGEERGAFVTLKTDGELRGCIGRPLPDQPLSDALEAAATEAATGDPRFPPVSPDELDSITVSMSVLTPPESLSGVGPGDIVVGRDGLILTRGRQSGLLLPQVAADREWTAEQFLGETARKAGLPPDAWKQAETTVKRFSAQVFAEESPHGRITVDDYTGVESETEPSD